MKKVMKLLCTAVFAGTATMVSPVFAEDVKPAAMVMSGYVQGGYTYNGNASAMTSGSGENDLRWLDHKANSFTLDLAQIVFTKDAAPGAAGFKVKLSAGESAKLIHAVGLGDATATSNPDSFDVTEAYASYISPIGKGLRYDFGKMTTFIGAEVLEAKDNPTYSRSLLFNYAEPLTHTGLKVSYTFTDAVNAALFVVNGWDNATDNNRSKSFGLSVGLTPVEIFSASFNVLQGPEQLDNSSNQRTLFDVVATIKPIKPLSIILNYDDGKEQKALAGADVKWSGVSGIVKYDFTDTYSLALRAESFDDKDGFRTGTVQKLTEVTVSPEIKLNNGLILKPEYRHDSSDKESFDNGTKKSQDTIALGVMYSW